MEVEPALPEWHRLSRQCGGSNATKALIRSRWEKQSIADAEQRPPRKYYTLTASGRATLDAAEKRYPLLSKLMPATVGKEE